MMRVTMSSDTLEVDYYRRRFSNNKYYSIRFHAIAFISVQSCKVISA